MKPVASEMPVSPAGAVRGQNHQRPFPLEKALAVGEQATRIVDVLDNMGHRDGVKSCIAQAGVIQLTLMHIEALRPRSLDCDRIRLDPRDLPAQVAHPDHEVAATAADV